VSTYIPENLRNQITDIDKSRCCYCLTSEANSGIPMTHDHIQPISKGGKTTFENVCLACHSCNEFKGDATQALDPLTGETVPLFNPRLDK
jgi:5-methylcytosine-specific restriction endonuclease McrA